MKKTIFSSLLLVLLIFSILSGCKVKQKASKITQWKEAAKIEYNASQSIVASDSTVKKLVDTTKTIKKATEKTTTKRTTEITIELDSGKKSFDLDTGVNSISDMVKAALKHAKSIRMKVEDEQTKEKETDERENKHVSSTESGLKKLAAKKDESSKEDRKSEGKNKEAVISKDSTVGINWLKLWPVIVIALLIGGFFLYKKFK
jgi:hypothetical protein